MAVAKVIEITAGSDTSFEDAIEKGVAKAGESVRNFQGGLGEGTAGRRRGGKDRRVPGRLESDVRPRVGPP